MGTVWRRMGLAITPSACLGHWAVSSPPNVNPSQALQSPDPDEFSLGYLEDPFGWKRRVSVLECFYSFRELQLPFVGYSKKSEIIFLSTGDSVTHRFPQDSVQLTLSRSSVCCQAAHTFHSALSGGGVPPLPLALLIITQLEAEYTSFLLQPERSSYDTGK